MVTVATNIGKNKVSYIKIDAENAGRRLDNTLFSLLKSVPKRHIYQIIRSGQLRINGRRAKPDNRLIQGDTLRIPPIHLTADKSIKLSIALEKILRQAILLEHPDVLVVDKPPGLASHGGSKVSCGLIEALRKIYAEPNLDLVHRLDKETSGCILVARKKSSLRYFHRELLRGRITRNYLALLMGNWPNNNKIIDAPLKKITNPNQSHVVKVDKTGKRALTSFKVISRFKSATLVKVKLMTGRTHQIRVHAAYSGHPVYGDSKYGGNSYHAIQKVARLFLHANSVRLFLPDAMNFQVVQSPLPDSLATVLDELEIISNNQTLPDC